MLTTLQASSPLAPQPLVLKQKKVGGLEGCRAEVIWVAGLQRLRAGELCAATVSGVVIRIFHS